MSKRKYNEFVNSLDVSLTGEERVNFLKIFEYLSNPNTISLMLRAIEHEEFPLKPVGHTLESIYDRYVGFSKECSVRIVECMIDFILEPYKRESQYYVNTSMFKHFKTAKHYILVEEVNKPKVRKSPVQKDSFVVEHPVYSSELKTYEMKTSTLNEEELIHTMQKLIEDYYYDLKEQPTVYFTNEDYYEVLDILVNTFHDIYKINVEDYIVFLKKENI